MAIRRELRGVTATSAATPIPAAPKQSPLPVRSSPQRIAFHAESAAPSRTITRNGSYSNISSSPSDRVVVTVATKPQPAKQLDSTSAASFERRLRWLEEDLNLIHQRLLRATGGGGPTSDSALLDLLARLEREAQAERTARKAWLDRCGALEDEIERGRADRLEQVKSFSTELNDTIKSFAVSVEQGLQAGVQRARERAEKTEERLKVLAHKVDEGVDLVKEGMQAAPSLKLQDKVKEELSPVLSPRLVRPPEQPPARPSEPAQPRSSTPRGGLGTPALAQEDISQLGESWAQLRDENERLRKIQAALQQQRSQSSSLARSLRASQHGSAIGSHKSSTIVSPRELLSPSLAIPQTLQVPGSGLNFATASET
eukprot:TRINITY_DN65258_c0_g1_i1.p1 TRINITY_DN65258_c0_g1~~TRINITY_DN65258_c0_g1_i1.p1  ORF type:complete len:404 (+),score=77.11 TRINITY_DN65258_c0_g1_i1:100-1212(+)